MKYTDKSFTVSLGGKSYADGWDAIFGKKSATEVRVAKPACEYEPECDPEAPCALHECTRKVCRCPVTPL